MNAHQCLNCGHELGGRFCAHCGQKADTHRITWKHFFLHDLLHGVWHLERGILFTLKEAFTRPGHAAMDYISGKRIRYYNVFYLILLVLAFHSVIENALTAHVPAAGHTASSDVVTAGDEPSRRASAAAAFMEHNYKMLISATIPLLALCSFIVFRRYKLNYAEHCIVAGIALLGINIIAVVHTVIENTFVSEQVSVFLAMIYLFYISYVYTQAFGARYTWAGRMWRVVLLNLLFVGLVVLGMALLLSFLWLRAK